jgi:hypothetical protein
MGRDFVKTFEAQCKDCGCGLRKKTSTRCRRCENTRRWSDPSYKKRVGRRISRSTDSSAIRRRMRKFWSETETEKRQHRSRGLWKGPEISKSQRHMRRLLGRGWRFEYAVGTGQGAVKHRGLPCRYLLDLAHPSKRINIEVDGDTHRTTTQKKKDRRRDRFLRKQEWEIIRISNRDVWTDRAREIAGRMS